MFEQILLPFRPRSVAGEGHLIMDAASSEQAVRVLWSLATLGLHGDFKRAAASLLGSSEVGLGISKER